MLNPIAARTFVRLWLILTSAAASAAVAAPPATSAYFTDPQQSHVQDQTGAGIAEVNMITCIMASVRPDALVNKGPYVALVDQNVCSNQTATVTSSADAAATQAPSYQAAVVNSLRATNTDPQRAKLWIDGSNEGVVNRIWVNLSATSAPSSGSPYGDFRLDFCQTVAGTSGCEGQGYMTGSATSLNFYQTETRSGATQTRALTLNALTTGTGSGALSFAQGGTTTAYAFAYDADLFRRSDGVTDQCFSRDATDPATGFTAWSYGLYDAATGSRLNLNSGIPITFTVNSTAYNAYVGYWGASVPATASGLLADGMPVQGITYDAATGNSTTTDYTMVLAAGRLVRYTRQTATLHDLDQIRFDVWVNDASTLYPQAPNNAYFEAYWDDATATFFVTGLVNCGGGSGCATTALPVPQPVSPAFWIPLGGVQAWSQSFGGDLYIDLSGATLPLAATSVPVAYRSQRVVNPGQMPAMLYCLNDCPTAATLARFFTAGSSDASPYGSSFNNYAATAANGVVTYHAAAGGAVLDDASGQPVILSNPAAIAIQPQYMNGIMTGRLFATLADAQCTPGTAGQYCDFRVSNLPDYFIWQTGAQPWNQFAGLKTSSGSFVAFDAPMPVTFSVPNSSTYGAYAGTSVVLQYGGFGQLYGFPNQCVDRSSNVSADCSAAGARVVPAFMIPLDRSVGVVHHGTTAYLAKWLNREIRLAPKDASMCIAANLSLPVNLTLPDATGLQNPADAGSTIYIGAEPTVTAAPRVIQGVVEY